MIGKKYSERQQRFSEQAVQLDKKYNLLSYIRLAFFLGAAGLMIWLVSVSEQSWVWWLVVPLLLLFVALAKWHNRIEKERDYYQNLTTINQRELDLVERHLFSEFENGARFIDYAHSYSSNLDVFGDRSIYQYLNRTVTLIGGRTLADWLNAPAQREEILARQEAVSELQSHTDWRQDLQAKGLNIKENEGDDKALLEWLRQPFTIINSTFIKTLTYVLPIAMGIAILATMVGFCSTTIPVFLWLFNLFFIKFTHRETTNIIEQVAKKAPLLETYHSLVEHFQNQEFEAEKLKQLQTRLTLDDKSAAEVIHRLSALSANLNIRSNMAAYLLFNTFFLWELVFCLKVENWKKQMQGNLKDWFDVLGEVESLTSMGTLYYNNPDWIQPSINDHYFALKAKEAGHVLLNPKHRVSNNLHIEKSGKIILITGSNMAGKSTFARTIGTNIVLALAGAPVCAEIFETSIATIYTSMRNRDSLQENESSFYAELKGLKRVIEVVEEREAPVFFLLDEILKGTNSKDRHQGSVALIKQLLRHNGVGLITTHDLALCEMAAQFPDAIENWCFEVAIEGDNMVFDYKIKQGACQSLNATKLMQQMGIEVE